MATRSEREGKEALNKHHQAVFAQLMMDQANQFCADCRLKDPRWASWNLGIFVCIDCSGIHRSIGTHISKVKSVNLDTWTTEQVENMVAWGNQRANDYWEQSLGPNFRPDRSSVPPPFPLSLSPPSLFVLSLSFVVSPSLFQKEYEQLHPGEVREKGVCQRTTAQDPESRAPPNFLAASSSKPALLFFSMCPSFTPSPNFPFFSFSFFFFLFSSFVIFSFFHFSCSKDESRSQSDKKGKTKEDMDRDREKVAADREAKLRAARRANKGGDSSASPTPERRSTPESREASKVLLPS